MGGLGVRGREENVPCANEPEKHGVEGAEAELGDGDGPRQG